MSKLKQFEEVSKDLLNKDAFMVQTFEDGKSQVVIKFGDREGSWDFVNSLSKLRKLIGD